MNDMKQKLFSLSILLMMVVGLMCSCDKDEPSEGSDTYASPRDWTYGKGQIQFYIDGVDQTSVSEITLKTNDLGPRFSKPDVFPWYYQTLYVKGLTGKNKIFTIDIRSDVERFEGATVYDGTEYDVTGEFTGDPFEHYSKMGVIVRLTSK